MRSFSAVVGILVAGVIACEPAGDQELDVEEAAELETTPLDGTQRDVQRAPTGTQPAPPAGAVSLRVERLDGADAYLTDAQGRALYLFTADSEGNSTCYDACAEAWPPLLAQQGQPSADAEPVQADLIGTIQRRDGSTQVTYGGHPLYYFVQDRGPGATTGQDVHGFGGEWYLVQPSGEALEAEGS